MLHRWMQQENVAKLPADFDGYLEFITQVLEDNQRKGGIAMKFEVAYFRPTTFGDPTLSQAAEIYKRYVSGGVPSEKDYRTFQDYIFRYPRDLEAAACIFRCIFTPRSASATILICRRAIS